MLTISQSQKLGLALSGGGFRASYFHIGVLAQMAEQGLLRYVEVISTVSGGTIIGALYYLHLKKLLESKPDEVITNQDYVDIVKQIETDFKKATDTNIRMSTFANLKTNLKFIRPDYSRTDRISELYNDLIYQDVLANETISNPVQMRELMIFPPNKPDFNPRIDNAERQAKVPIIIIHATSLNTGRDWHFTAQTMGEPIQQDEKGASNYEETDSKPVRLRRARPSYNNLAQHQQDFELGHAVGASACVPALFPPLAISNLYQDGNMKIRVQLVDGGVYDNQGIAGLLYENCNRFIVSDASAQFNVEHEPSTTISSVLWRGFDSIFPDRVRAESLQQRFEVANRDNIAFMHLRKGLEIHEIPWIDKNGKIAEPTVIREASTLQFGVAPVVQEHLSNMRTDLDTFSEVEAYSLMLDGYLMSSSELRNFSSHAGYNVDTSGNKSFPLNGAWDFLKIASRISKPTQDYLKQLKVGKYSFGKPILLIPKLAVLTICLSILFITLFWPYFLNFMQDSIPNFVIIMILAAILADIFLRRLESNFKFFRYLEIPIGIIRRFIFNVLPPLIGMLFFKIYLRYINPLFLKRGSIKELDRREPLN